MRPRPWLLLCVSLHGVAASVYGFPSWKHGLDYCIAEADTHHRHDSVDHHGTSNHMWDAYAALHSAAYISVNINVAGMCEHNPIHELDYCIAEDGPPDLTVAAASDLATHLPRRPRIMLRFASNRVTGGSLAFSVYVALTYILPGGGLLTARHGSLPKLSGG